MLDPLFPHFTSDIRTVFSALWVRTIPHIIISAQSTFPTLSTTYKEDVLWVVSLEIKNTISIVSQFATRKRSETTSATNWLNELKGLLKRGQVWIVLKKELFVV